MIENGLPSSDELTIYGLGATWTDQQWLAQVFMYGVYSLGGFALLSIVDVRVRRRGVRDRRGGVALARRRRRERSGSSSSRFSSPRRSAGRSAPRCSTLPLYTGLLWLLASQARRPTRRVWLALPMLVVWANMHGSAALGALLVMLLGGYELVRSRGATLDAQRRARSSSRRSPSS